MFDRVSSSSNSPEIFEFRKDAQEKKVIFKLANAQLLETDQDKEKCFFTIWNREKKLLKENAVIEVTAVNRESGICTYTFRTADAEGCQVKSEVEDPHTVSSVFKARKKALKQNNVTINSGLGVLLSDSEKTQADCRIWEKAGRKFEEIKNGKEPHPISVEITKVEDDGYSFYSRDFLKDFLVLKEKKNYTFQVDQNHVAFASDEERELVEYSIWRHCNGLPKDCTIMITEKTAAGKITFYDQTKYLENQNHKQNVDNRAGLNYHERVLAAHSLFSHNSKGESFVLLGYDPAQKSYSYYLTDNVVRYSEEMSGKDIHFSRVEDDYTKVCVWEHIKDNEPPKGTVHVMGQTATDFQFCFAETYAAKAKEKNIIFSIENALSYYGDLIFATIMKELPEGTESVNIHVKSQNADGSYNYTIQPSKIEIVKVNEGDPKHDAKSKNVTFIGWMSDREGVLNSIWAKVKDWIPEGAKINIIDWVRDENSLRYLTDQFRIEILLPEKDHKVSLKVHNAPKKSLQAPQILHMQETPLTKPTEKTEGKGFRPEEYKVTRVALEHIKNTGFEWSLFNVLNAILEFLFTPFIMAYSALFCAKEHDKVQALFTGDHKLGVITNHKTLLTQLEMMTDLFEQKGGQTPVIDLLKDAIQNGRLLHDALHIDKRVYAEEESRNWNDEKLTALDHLTNFGASIWYRLSCQTTTSFKEFATVALHNKIPQNEGECFLLPVGIGEKENYAPHFLLFYRKENRLMVKHIQYSPPHLQKKFSAVTTHDLGEVDTREFIKDLIHLQTVDDQTVASPEKAAERVDNTLAMFIAKKINAKNDEIDLKGGQEESKGKVSVHQERQKGSLDPFKLIRNAIIEADLHSNDEEIQENLQDLIGTKATFLRHYVNHLVSFLEKNEAGFSTSEKIKVLQSIKYYAKQLKHHLAKDLNKEDGIHGAIIAKDVTDELLENVATRLNEQMRVLEMERNDVKNLDGKVALFSLNLENSIEATMTAETEALIAAKNVNSMALDPQMMQVIDAMGISFRNGASVAIKKERNDLLVKLVEQTKMVAKLLERGEVKAAKMHSFALLKALPPPSHADGFQSFWEKLDTKKEIENWSSSIYELSERFFEAALRAGETPLAQDDAIVFNIATKLTLIHLYKRYITYFPDEFSESVEGFGAVNPSIDQMFNVKEEFFRLHEMPLYLGKEAAGLETNDFKTALADIVDREKDRTDFATFPAYFAHMRQKLTVACVDKAAQLGLNSDSKGFMDGVDKIVNDVLKLKFNTLADTYLRSVIDHPDNQHFVRTRALWDGFLAKFTAPLRAPIDAEFANVLKHFKDEVVQGAPEEKKKAYESQLSRLNNLYQLKSFFVAQRRDQIQEAETKRLEEKWKKEDEEEQNQIKARDRAISSYDAALRKHEQGQLKLQSYLEEMQAWAEGRGSKPRFGLDKKSSFPAELERHYTAQKVLPQKRVEHQAALQALRDKLTAYNQAVLDKYNLKIQTDRNYLIDSELPEDSPGNYAEKIRGKFRSQRSSAAMGWGSSPKSHETVLRELLEAEVANLRNYQQHEIDELEDRANNVPVCNDVPPRPIGNRPEPIIARKIREPEVLKAEREVELANAIKAGLRNDAFLTNVDSLVYHKMSTTKFWFEDAYQLNEEMQAFCGQLARVMGISKESYAETLYALKGKLTNVLDQETKAQPQKLLLMLEDNSLTNFGSRPEMAQLRKDCARFVNQVAEDQTPLLNHINRVHFLIGYNDRRENGDGLRHFPHKGFPHKNVNDIFENQVQLASTGYGFADENDGLDLLTSRHVSRVTRFMAMASVLENPELHVESYRWTNLGAAFNIFSIPTNERVRADLKNQDRIFLVAAEQGKDYTGNRLTTEKRAFVLSSQRESASGSYCTRPSFAHAQMAKTAFRKDFHGSPTTALIDAHLRDDNERELLWRINLLHRPAVDYTEQEKKAELARWGDLGVMSQKKTIKEFLLRTSAVVDPHAKNPSDHPFSWYTVVFTLNCIRECADELVDETWGRQVRDKLLSNVFQAGLIEEALINNPDFFLTAIPHLNELISYYKREKEKDKESGTPARYDAASLCIHNICDKIRKAALTLNQHPKKFLSDLLFERIDNLLPKDYKGKIEGFRANGGPFQKLFALAHLEYFREHHKDLFKSFASSPDWLSILRSHAIVMQVASEEGHSGVQEEVRHYLNIKLMPSIEEFLRRDVEDQAQRDAALTTIAALNGQRQWFRTKDPYQYKVVKEDGSIQDLDLNSVEQTSQVQAIKNKIEEFEKERNNFLTALAGLTLKETDPKWTFSDAKPYEYHLIRDDGSLYVLNISTGQGVELNGEFENRGGLPQHVLDHPDFKFLFGDKKHGSGWRTPPAKGDLIEYRWRDTAAEIDYLIRVNKREKTFQIFQEHKRVGEKSILFRFTRIKIDESFLSISFNENNKRVEDLISQKGAWVRLDANEQPEKDRVYVAQMGHRIDKDQIRLHVRKNPITGNSKITRASVGEGSNRKWVVSGMEKGSAPLLPFKNLEHVMLLSSDGAHVDEIRFFKPQADGTMADTNAYYLALRRNENNRDEWDVVNRKGWKWQLHNTAHLDKQFGENWRENSLHLINTETGEEEHWFFPYIAVGNEKNGSSVHYMKSMLNFVDLLKEMFNSGLATVGITNETLNQKAREFFTYFFKDVFHDNDHELAPDKMGGEIILQEIFNEFMEAPFDILRAAFGSASEAYSEKREKIIKKAFIRVYEFQLKVESRLAGGGAGLNEEAREVAIAELEKLVDSKMKKFLGDLNKFFKGILSPAPLKIGQSGQSGSHAAFLYQAHVASLRGDYAVASDYLNRMVTKGVSNSEDDIEQLEFLLTKVILRDSLTQLVQGQLAHPVGLRQTAFQLKLILDLKCITPRLETQHKRRIGSLMTKLLSQFDASKFQMAGGLNPAKVSGDLSETVILSMLAREYRSKLKTKKGELQSQGLLLTKKEDETLRTLVPLDLLALFDSNDKASLLTLLPPDQQAQIKEVMALVGIEEKSAIAPKIKFTVPSHKEVNVLIRTVTQNMNGDQMVDIKELHKKKGSYPKWETLISNFYSYVHWIYYTEINPEELSFLMAEIPLLTKYRAEIETARNLLLLFYHHRTRGYFQKVDDDGLHSNRDDFTDALKKIQALAPEFASDEVEENIREYRRQAAFHPSGYDLAQWTLYRYWGSASKWLNQGGDVVKVGPEKQKDHGRFHELHAACKKVLHTHLLDHYVNNDNEVTARGLVEQFEEAPAPLPVAPQVEPPAPQLTNDQVAALHPKERVWYGSSGGRLKGPLKILVRGLLTFQQGTAAEKEKVAEKVVLQLKVHVDALLDHDDFYSGYKEFTEVLACFSDWMLALANHQQASVSGALRATQDPNFLPSQFHGSSAPLTILLQQIHGLKKALEAAHTDYQKFKPSKRHASESKKEIKIDVAKQNATDWGALFGRTDVLEDGNLNPRWETKLATEIAIAEKELSKLPDSSSMEVHYLKKYLEGVKKSSRAERRYKCTRSLQVTEVTPLSRKINDRLKVLNREIAELQAVIDILVRANSESLEIVSLIAYADELGRTQEGNRLGKRIFSLILDKYKEGKIKSLELETKLTNFLLACTERDQLKMAQDVVRIMHTVSDGKAKGLPYTMDEVDLALMVQEDCDRDILWLLMSHDLFQYLSEGSDRKRYAKGVGGDHFVLDQPSIYKKYLVLDFEKKQIARLRAKESIEKIVNGQKRPIIVAQATQVQQIEALFKQSVLGINDKTTLMAIRAKKDAFVTRAEFDELSRLQDALYVANKNDERIFEITKLKKRLYIIEGIPIRLPAADVETTIADLQKNDHYLLITPEEFRAIKDKIKDLNQVVEFNHKMSLAGVYEATTKKIHFDKVRMGVGKSTNIFPLSNKILIERGYEPVVVTTEELLMQLRDFMDEKAFIFEFNISYGLLQEESRDDNKVIAHLTRLRDSLWGLKAEGRYPLTTPARLGFIRNKRAELENQLLFLQAGTPEERRCFEKLQLMKEISSYFWRQTPQGEVPRPGIVFLEDEDVCRDISKEYNYAIGEKGPVDRIFFNMFDKFVLEMMQYKDEKGEYKFRNLLLTNALRSISDITEELIPVLIKLYDDTAFWENKAVGWQNWKKIDRQQFIDYITGKTNKVPDGVPQNTRTDPVDLKDIYNAPVFWKKVGVVLGKPALTLAEFETFMGTKEFPPSYKDHEERVILEKLYVCYDYWKKVGGPFKMQEIEAYITGKRKDPPVGMQHTCYLAALRALLTNKNGTMGAVYHINADMSRGFDPNNHCEVMPYSDGVPKPNHMFGVVKEYILHHLLQYAAAVGDKGIDEDLFWNFSKDLLKDHDREAISPLDPDDTWSNWNDRISERATHLPGDDRGNKYKAFTSPECFKERMQFLRYLMFESPYMKIYHQQVTCNSQDVTLGRKPIMASGTGDPFSLNLDDPDHDASKDPDMITGETLLGLFSLKDGYHGDITALEGLNKPIEKPFNDIEKQFEALAKDQYCRAIINSGFEVCQNKYEKLVAKLRMSDSCKHRQFLYVDSRTRKRMIWNPGEDAVPVEYHPDQVNKKLAIALYGPAQKRGIEFMLPKGEKDFGVFMVDLSSTIEEVAQGLYRMRQFGYGQEGRLLPDTKMAKYISKITGKPENKITQGDVIKAVCRKTVEADKLRHVKALVFKFKEYLKQEVDEILRMPYDLVGVQDPQALILFEKIVFKIHRDLYIQTESIDWMKMFSDQTEVDRLEYIEKMLHLEIKRVQKIKLTFQKDTDKLRKEIGVKGSLAIANNFMAFFGRGAPAPAAPNPAPQRVRDQIEGRYNQLMAGYDRAEASLKLELEKLKNEKIRQYYNNNLPEKIPADLDGHANMDMVVEMQVEMQQEQEEQREQEQQSEINVPEPQWGNFQPLDFDHFRKVAAVAPAGYGTTFYSLLDSSRYDAYGFSSFRLIYPGTALGKKLDKYFSGFHPYISLRAEKFLQTKGTKGDASLFVLVIGSGANSKSCIITESDLTNKIGPALKKLRDDDDELAVAVLPLTSRAELTFKKEDLEPMYLDSGDVQARTKLQRFGLAKIMLFNKFVLDWTNYTQEELACYEEILKDKPFTEGLHKYLDEICSVKTKNLIERNLKRLTEEGARLKKDFLGIVPDILFNKFVVDCTYYDASQQDAFNKIIENEGLALRLAEHLKSILSNNTAYKIKAELKKAKDKKAANMNNVDHDEVALDIAINLRPGFVAPSELNFSVDKHNGDYQTQDEKKDEPDTGALGMPLGTPAKVPPTPATPIRSINPSTLPGVADVELDRRGFITIHTSDGKYSMLKIRNFNRVTGVLELDSSQKYLLTEPQRLILPPNLAPYMEEVS